MKTLFISSSFLFLYLSVNPLLSLFLSLFFPPPLIPIACLSFTRPCSSLLPGNKMWQELVRFEGTRNGHCESFLLFLNTFFPLFSARETLYQQMGKTDITINLFFENEWRTSNVIHCICFIVQYVRVCARACVCVSACSLRCFCMCCVCVLMFVWWNRWCSDLCVRLRNLLMSLLAWKSVNTRCYTERKIQIWWKMQRTVNTDQEQIYFQCSSAVLYHHFFTSLLIINILYSLCIYDIRAR